MIMSVRASSLAAVELEVSLDGKKVASLYLLTESSSRHVIEGDPPILPR